MLPWAGNRADFRLYEGCGVSSVASRDMAAGLQALSAMIVFARTPAPFLPADQSSRATRLLAGRFENEQRRRVATPAGTAVPGQKRAEFRFGGAAASCYPCGSMGAGGGVAITSHKPN
ncbi:MAG: hypothetical protein EKK33_12470 [Bradyrhizobiaceae bacterium]|nr:MAG: hypothetical protein EKK33_12470 [Bradyrhizobiaceae bacterium]